MVLRKEVRGRRVLPNTYDEEGILFRMGRDDEFEGLRPDRDVGEHEVAPAETGVNVVIQQVIRANNARPGRRAAGNHEGPGGRRGRRGGRGGREAQELLHRQGNIMAEDVDEDGIQPENHEIEERGRRRPGSRRQHGGNRNVRQRSVVEEESLSNGDTTSQSESPRSETASSASLSSEAENSNDEQVRWLQN